MSTDGTIDELRTLSREELEREMKEKRFSVAKIRIAIRLQKEKDTARLRKERRTLARLSMVFKEREKGLETGKKAP